ncbi:hypothetical protein GmHk_14G041542 [Glycine max]|nr:hypothetical protein GmHk_14G041542 [Glycine max]
MQRMTTKMIRCLWSLLRKRKHLWRRTLFTNTLHNFRIQYKNITPELLDAIRKVRDELQIDLNFKGKQTTIESYFNRV